MMFYAETLDSIEDKSIKKSLVNSIPDYVIKSFIKWYNKQTGEDMPLIKVADYILNHGIFTKQATINKEYSDLPFKHYDSIKINLNKIEYDWLSIDGCGINSCGGREVKSIEFEFVLNCKTEEGYVDWLRDRI